MINELQGIIESNVLASGPLLFVLAGMTASILSVILMAIRYSIILSKVDEKLPIRSSVFIIFVAQLASYIAPFRVGAIATRTVTTKIIEKVPLKKSVLATTIENIYEFGWQIMSLPLLLILIGEAMTINSLQVEILLITSFCALLFILLRSPNNVFTVIWKMRRVIPKRLLKRLKTRKLGKKELKRAMDKSAEYVKDWKILLHITLPTLLLLLISPLIIQFSGLFFSVHLDFRVAFLVYWTSLIIGRLSGLPGGFVSRDLTMIGVLGIFGVNAILGTQITLIYRFMTMTPVIVFGSLSFIYMGKRRGSTK